jgi:Fe2+ transport system protein FeoA
MAHHTSAILNHHREGLSTSLDKMNPGQEVMVTGVELHSPLHRRLLELGVVPGRHVVCLRSSLFRDPIAFQFGSTCLSLRRSEASLVTVDISA